MYKIFLTIITTFFALATLFPMLGISEVLSEPLIQAQIYMCLALLIVFLLCVITKFWLTAVLYMGMIAMHFGIVTQVYPLSEHPNICPATGTNISVMTYNIYYKNHDTQAIVANILSEDPDILMLQEGKDEFLKRSYDALSENYAFFYPDIAKDRNSSPSIFSKFPIKKIDTPKLPISAQRLLQATIQIDGQDIDFMPIHAVSPKSAKTIKKRNMLLQDLANHAQKLRYENKKFIIAGDFNSVPWHPKMLSLQNQGAMTGNPSLWNYFGTWPDWGAPFISVPIDHIFSSQGIKKISYKKVSHSAGSDHFPIKSTLIVCK